MSILLDGLSLGAVYALIALGYTMVYGIAKMLNFAHGDFIMIGAYTILTIITKLGGNVYLGFVTSVLVCCIVGVLTEKLAYKPLRGASPLAVLITAIGVSYLLQGAAQLIFGAKPQPISLPHYGSVNIAGSEISINTIVTLIVGAAIMVALQFFVKKTKTGRAMVAVSEDRGAAQLMGINVNNIITVTFAIGSALAAFASFFYLMPIPTLGSLPGIKAFTAAVIGGIGSIPGAMIGGVLLGIVEKVCLSIPAIKDYTTAIEFSLLIVILLIRPIGILGKKRREKV